MPRGRPPKCGVNPFRRYCIIFNKYFKTTIFFTEGVKLSMGMAEASERTQKAHRYMGGLLRASAIEDNIYLDKKPVRDADAFIEKILP